MSFGSQMSRYILTKQSALNSSTLSYAKDYVLKNLCKIVELDEEYGFSGDNFEKFNPQNICVEYSSPNIAKKFHAGHLRSTFVGNAIANILEAPGNKVTRINYLGDWGMQFALLAIGFEKYGDKKLLDKDPIKHLHEVYVRTNRSLEKDDTSEKARQLFCDMENNTTEPLRFWKICRDISLIKLKDLYKSLNIAFDYYDSESMYLDDTKKLICQVGSSELAHWLPNHSLAMNATASTWQKSSKGLDLMHVTLTRSDGTTLYRSRDVAAAIKRKEKFDFDKMYYVTDMSQANHFVQVFSILEQLGHHWAAKNEGVLNHVGFGRVIGMKTRTGDSVFADDILSEALQCIREERLRHATRKSIIACEDDVIRHLALSGLVCADLKSKIGKDYRFSWPRVLDSKGDTGIFMQYSHSRLQNLKKNCGFDISLDIDCDCIANDSVAIDLFQHLLKYTEVCWLAYTDLQPCHLTNYMFRLAHYIGKAHRNLQVKDEDILVAQPRLLLLHCAQIVLRNCMKTLGIHPLDSM